MDESRRIRVFDTTLRDGQQCPGAGMSFKQNLEYARLAAEVRVDVLEAGFPSANKVDFEIVHAIAELAAANDRFPVVAGLCQLRDEQIDRTMEALLPAVSGKKAMLHTYVPVSPALMEASLGEKAKDKSQIAKNVYAFIKRATDAGLEVEFSPEGYSRVAENFDFCTDLCRAAVEAGVSVINCPDTIGGSCVLEGEEYFVNLMNRHAEIIKREFPSCKVIWSTHCHNDFGLAVQNTVNAVFYGPSRQIEGCFTGVGERAGNAALEQTIIVIRQFAQVVDPQNPFYTTINTQRIQEICDFVSSHMLPSQPHLPVSGQNAARHSSGGHTNAILRNPLAYQPFDPSDIGKEISFLFGPMSGGNHAKAIINQRGYICEDAEKVEISQFIKNRYADRRKGITDDELMRAYFEYRNPISVDKYEYSKSSNLSKVFLSGKFFDTTNELNATHSGPDSALAALKEAVDRHYGPLKILSHKSQSDKEGHDARSLSTIVLSDPSGNVYEGRGEDQDIEISAMKAFIDGVNRAYVEAHYRLSPNGQGR